ncbi:hypothetical protein J1614_005236 [Plenodomus biglobosus]|nr:hypothetical protein J1614_005236 [Plenodomus biglobosus]
MALYPKSNVSFATLSVMDSSANSEQLDGNFAASGTSSKRQYAWATARHLSQLSRIPSCSTRPWHDLGLDPARRVGGCMIMHTMHPFSPPHGVDLVRAMVFVECRLSSREIGGQPTGS